LLQEVQKAPSAVGFILFHSWWQGLGISILIMAKEIKFSIFMFDK
jgi:hypothetical protein